MTWKDPESYDRYQREMRFERDRSPETVRSYEFAWLEFCEHLPSTATLEEVPEALARYRTALRARRLKEGTIYSRLSAVHSYFQWCCDVGLVKSDPLYRLRLPRQDKNNPRPIPPPDQLKAVLPKLRQLPRRDRLVIALGVYAGLRAGEIRNLNVENIDLRRGVITVLNAKGHKDRTVTMHPELIELLRREIDKETRAARCPSCGYGDGGPLIPGMSANGDGPDQRISKTMPWKAVKRHFPDYSPHSLRALFITVLLEQGVPLEEVQLEAGHESPETTMRYRGRRNVAAKQRIRAVDFTAGVPDADTPPQVISINRLRNRRGGR